MLFWIWVILIALAIIVFVLCDKFDRYGEYTWTYMVLALVGTMGVLLSSCFLIDSRAGLDGYVSKMHTRHDVLVYQYENNVYDNDNDLGKRDLMEDIREWNEDLAYYKTNQHDFWLGIFIPNVYDQFDYIELAEVDGNG